MSDPTEDVEVLALIERVAHELKNASWALSGYTEMALGKVQRGALGKLDKELDTLESAGLRLAHLSREIRALVAMECGAAPRPEELDVGEVLGAVRARLLEELPEAGGRIGGDLPAAPLVAERVVLERVLEHLLRNALLHGTGEVRVDLEPSPGGRLQLAVVDDGPGPEPLDVEEWTRPYVSGTGRLGIGLTVCRFLSERLGGGLEISSAGDGPTRVTLEVATGVPPAGPGAAGSVSASLSADRPGARTALFMDDQAMNRQLVRRALEAEGWRVLLAEDGEEGLALARQHPADVILIDLHMPKVTGPEVAAALRGEGVTAPLVGFTASEPHEIRDPTVRERFDCFLQKGVGIQDLSGQLHALLRERAGPSPSPTQTRAGALLEGLRALAATPVEERAGRAAALLEELRALAPLLAPAPPDAISGPPGEDG